MKAIKIDNTGSVLVQSGSLKIGVYTMKDTLQRWKSR